MNLDLLEWLACPTDPSHSLRLIGTPPAGGQVDQGELRCASCGSGYPVVAGIPSFLAAAHESLSELQQREREAREREYGAREKYESEVERLPELDAVRSALGDCHGLRILDAGCGTGEMTQAAEGAARLVAIDFSWSGLIAHRLLGAPSVDLIQGDVSRLPLRDGLFDASISTGVFQHLPSQSQRAVFLGHLHRTLRPGGKLVLTTFNWNMHHRRAGVAKEGFFDNGIFRRRFERGELQRELENQFDIESIAPVQIFLPKTYRLVRALGTKSVLWDRAWRRFGFSCAYSNLLLARCRRRR